ncbi:TlpA family protein disulfide reductase [Sphingobacterium kyonggiense]
MKHLNLIFLTSLLLFLSCKQPNKEIKEGLAIVAGSSKITGSIHVPDNLKKDSTYVNVIVLYPISGEVVKYETLVDTTGKFSLDFDVETDTTYISISTSLEPSKHLFVRSINADVTKIDITYQAGLTIKNIEVSPSMNKYDVLNSMDVFNKMVLYRPKEPGWEYPRLFDKSIEEVLKFAKNATKKRLEMFLDKDNILSKEIKSVLIKDFHLFRYSGGMFNYESEMLNNYRNSTRDTVNTPEIQKIDRTYFRFLKDFNLNDPQYLQAYSFPEFQDSILRNPILGLPAIGEQDVATWLGNVKDILSDLVGFEEGQYYDILAANAFGRQLKEELKPLSEKQKENISQYWKDGEIAKILFRKNQQVLELNKVNSPVVVNDVSTVSKDKVIEIILSKYMDKVVFIDLWATWCGPCLSAMNEFRAVKGEFYDKDVVFVYLTNGSSPKKLWEEKIQGIGSEHYYLNNDQWMYIMNQFDFEGIPSYLLYDKKGELKDKFTSFPGNRKVKGMINGLL